MSLTEKTALNREVTRLIDSIEDAYRGRDIFRLMKTELLDYGTDDERVVKEVVRASCRITAMFEPNEGEPKWIENENYEDGGYDNPDLEINFFFNVIFDAHGKVWYYIAPEEGDHWEINNPRLGIEIALNYDEKNIVKTQGVGSRYYFFTDVIQPNVLAELNKRLEANGREVAHYYLWGCGHYEVQRLTTYTNKEQDR